MEKEVERVRLERDTERVAVCTYCLNAVEDPITYTTDEDYDDLHFHLDCLDSFADVVDVEIELEADAEDLANEIYVAQFNDESENIDVEMEVDDPLYGVLTIVELALLTVGTVIIIVTGGITYLSLIGIFFVICAILSSLHNFGYIKRYLESRVT